MCFSNMFLRDSVLMMCSVGGGVGGVDGRGQIQRRRSQGQLHAARRRDDGQQRHGQGNTSRVTVKHCI